MHHLSVLALATLAATAIAQTNVLPTSAATSAGSTGNVFPWGTTAYPGMRIMCLYDSSHFTAAPVPITGPIFITSIRWRADDVATTTTWTGGTYPTATVRLATAAVDYTLASTSWASNLGPDVAVVHNGPVTVAGGSGNGVGVPGPYTVTITLTTPFLYNPAAGDLVVDTEHVPNTFAGGTLQAFDVTTTAVNASRVYSSTLYPVANGVDSACDVIEIGFIPAVGTPATNTPLGVGCISTYTSFYEYTPNPPTSFDLGNTGFTLNPAGGGYVVTNGGAFIPVGTVSAPVVIAVGDDVEQTITLTAMGPFPAPTGPAANLTVCSNGFVSTGVGNGTNWVPDINAMLNGPQTSWRCWHDYANQLGGSVKFEQSPGVSVITWDNVRHYGGTGVADDSTWQLQFYPSGQVIFAFGTMSTVTTGTIGTGGAYLVGYSPGGSSANPGNTDISAALGAGAILTSATDQLPLTLTGVTRPITGTSWNRTVSNIPASGVFGISIYGIADPGILDLFFLGLPGCQLRSTLDLMDGPWIVGGSTQNISFAIPANPSLINFHLFSQAAVWTVPALNAFGAITSGGIDGKVGDI